MVNQRPKRKIKPAKHYGNYVNINTVRIRNETSTIVNPTKISKLNLKSKTPTKKNSVPTTPTTRARKLKLSFTNSSLNSDDGTTDNENDDNFEPTTPKQKRYKIRIQPKRKSLSNGNDNNCETKENKSMKITNNKNTKRNNQNNNNNNNNNKTKPKQKPKKTLKKIPTSNEEALEEALIKLHSSSVPESLPCREYQFDDIYNFVSRKLFENEGGCMYISGVPGTGKTATLLEVKRKLLNDAKNLPKFRFIEINGLKLAQPNRFYSHFLLELEGIKKSDRQAADILIERFTNVNIKKDFVILFIDELDYLKTKKQDILYHIFDWPNRKDSKLIVLAVANSMDLPERLLVNRVSSRLGLTRLLFQPYSFKELEKIATSRLEDLYGVGYQIFESDALELICRKVSAVSGDARRVLDICRRSVEIAIADGHGKISMKIVDKALKEIFNSIKMTRIMQASIQEQIFLRALLKNYRSSGLEEFQFIEIYQTHADICRFEGHFVPNTTELSTLANNLDLSKIILLERSHSHMYRRIRLNVSADDIAFALNVE